VDVVAGSLYIGRRGNILEDNHLAKCPRRTEVPIEEILD
jgi:hypothetical protein